MQNVRGTAGAPLPMCALAWALLLGGCGDDGDAPARTPTGVTPTAPTAQQAPVAVAPAPPPPPPPSDWQTVGPYRVDVGRRCAGLPYVPLKTLPGRCVGLVTHGGEAAIAAARGRFRPRSLVQDPRRDDVMWIIDGGARRPGGGRVWRLSLADGAWRAELVLRGLNRPHGSRLGPDGKVYVGDLGRIFRFDPRAEDVAASVEVVLADLPTRRRGEDKLRLHPLKSFVFMPNWDLVVNMGSSTDRCLTFAEGERCPDEALHVAGLWRFAYLGDHRWSSTPTYLAQGLRNSVALVAHSSGTLLQGENGVDFSEGDRPHEELNVIVAGKHYGWPYCYDRDTPDPRWRNASFSCDPAENPDYAPPLLLLPPHAAPLGMAYYAGTEMPELSGELLVGYHGYRAPGHRLVAFAVDGRGLPAAGARSTDVIAGWDATESSPRGAPVELTVARDGSVWLVEDKNGTVLRLARDRWSAHRDPSAITVDAPLRVPDARFVAIHAAVFRPRCSRCHEFMGGDASGALNAMAREGWLLREGNAPRMAEHFSPGAERPMPPDVPLNPDELARVRAWLQVAPR